MTLSVALDKVSVPRSIKFQATQSDGKGNVLIQIYTGMILFDFNIEDNHVKTNDIACYIPLEDLSLQPYRDTRPEITVVGSLTGAYVKDTPHLAAVTNVTAQLEPNQFVGVSGPQNVLVLRADVAAMNGSAQSVAYQVTIKTRDLQPAQHVPTNGSEVPG